MTRAGAAYSPSLTPSYSQRREDSTPTFRGLIRQATGGRWGNLQVTGKQWRPGRMPRRRMINSIIVRLAGNMLARRLRFSGLASAPIKGGGMTRPQYLCLRSPAQKTATARSITCATILGHASPGHSHADRAFAIERQRGRVVKPPPDHADTIPNGAAMAVRIGFRGHRRSRERGDRAAPPRPVAAGAPLSRPPSERHSA